MSDAVDEAKLNEIKTKLKDLLVDQLSLDDIDPASIDDDAPLFGEGLGLDSLDAVEIVVLLQRNFGIDVKSADQGREAFESINTLARFVVEHSAGDE